jgi:glycogen debranching enzyme
MRFFVFPRQNASLSDKSSRPGSCLSSKLLAILSRSAIPSKHSFHLRCLFPLTDTSVLFLHAPDCLSPKNNRGYGSSRETPGFQIMQPMVPVMSPAPGERLLRFVGDFLQFQLKTPAGAAVKGWQARLRTNIGRAEVLRREILQAHTHGLALAGASWRDLPMSETGDGWAIDVPLGEVGYFKGKAYLVDPRGWQHWPEGSDVGISVHPDRYRTGNTIYCAFTRQFGGSFSRVLGTDQAELELEKHIEKLDKLKYTVIPPSGTLRDLAGQCQHIIKELGCRVLHLLPVHPTPTTGPRFGRFGSPYAALDFTAIDPALVVFDKRTTGIDQFRELTYKVHSLGGRVFLDIVINHTGWGSVMMETHPEWFERKADGMFVSPGAWGVTWEDLVELKHHNIDLWDHLSDIFLVWCRRGVDGFRCDAGYMIPVDAWQYIIARVQQEYPETVFLLEGLGGAWELTEGLLTEGGMQWAYSELFQNYSAVQVSGYLDHATRQSGRVGVLVHYSETHDNARLAAKGRAWSLLRNRLCALASVSGGFGFTCGVEWLAKEQIKVHGRPSLDWGSKENIIPELSRLNRLLSDHPCFFDGAKLTRLSPPDSAVFALLRVSEEGKDRVLVLVNTDAAKVESLEFRVESLGGVESKELRVESAEGRKSSVVSDQSSVISKKALGAAGGAGGSGRVSHSGVESESSKLSVESRAKGEGGQSAATGVAAWMELLGQRVPKVEMKGADVVSVTLPGGAAFCLAPTAVPTGLHGPEYRRARAQASGGLAAINRMLPTRRVGNIDWRVLAQAVDRSPSDFLSMVSYLANNPDAAVSVSDSISKVGAGSWRTATSHLDVFPCVVTWSTLDTRRVTLVPPGHWLLLQDTVPFRATLKASAECGVQSAESFERRTQNEECGTKSSESVLGEGFTRNVESFETREGHFAVFGPREIMGDAMLVLERYADREQHVEGKVRFLSAEPEVRMICKPSPDSIVLLTNGRGGMARMCVDLGRVRSKYDCVLGANLHPTLPVDRHVLAKRVRVWVNAEGFLSPLDERNLDCFGAGPPAVWDFVAQAGDGRTVEIQITAEMLEGQNTTVFHFSRPSEEEATGKQLPADADVRLTVRLDIEDRNFHSETKRNGGAEHHFSSNTRTEVESSESLKRRMQNEECRMKSPKVGGLGAKVGFSFTAARDRQLRVYADAGFYHPQPEWSDNIAHPVEQSRGQTGSGDAFSPGWFELPLVKGAHVRLVVTAEAGEVESSELRVESSESFKRRTQNEEWGTKRPEAKEKVQSPELRVESQARGQRPESSVIGVQSPVQSPESGVQGPQASGAAEIIGREVRAAEEAGGWEVSFGEQLMKAVGAFVVQRGSGKTVIAGYPWFLDWGRDTFICARGLLAAGMLEEVKQLLVTFARFEKDGTLPNTIFGEDASNRDTSDAPLWFAVVCEELAELTSKELYETKVDRAGRPLRDVLESIAMNYARGTPNGIRMDPASGLIWSPSHFTWMDTNYPAATPRQGYPVEIQALWVRLLRQLERIGGRIGKEEPGKLCELAAGSLERLFWDEQRGYYADVLLGQSGQPAEKATRDDALRSNCLFVVSLGRTQNAERRMQNEECRMKSPEASEHAKRCVEAVRRYLVIPGALRSLAPLPVSVPLPVHGNQGGVLNNPSEPYWGRYEGDEDTRRKPAYHNGTGWTWTFPVFCEALAKAWDFEPRAVAAAKAYLGSIAALLGEGCLGQLPEVVDGDAPHTQRGCDAQAWGTTEALRVWKQLRVESSH